LAKPTKISSGSNRSISLYLSEIGRYEPLPPEREVELAIRIQKGDDLAMKELIESNICKVFRLYFFVLMTTSFRVESTPCRFYKQSGCQNSDENPLQAKQLL